MVVRAAEPDEDTVPPAHSRAAALFQRYLDTEPPCVSKRVFRTLCNPCHQHRTAALRERTSSTERMPGG
jgi:hypothetical protein